MKKVTTAIAVLSGLAVSLPSVANNTMTANVALSGYFAAGLVESSVTALNFGGFVVADRDLNTTITVPCSGSVGRTNATVYQDDNSSIVTAAKGSIVLTGEPNKVLDVTVVQAATPALPAGVTISGEGADDDCDSGTDVAIDGNGDLTLNVYGNLVIDNSEADETQSINAQFDVTVNYR